METTYLLRKVLAKSALGGLADALQPILLYPKSLGTKPAKLDL